MGWKKFVIVAAALVLVSPPSFAQVPEAERSRQCDDIQAKVIDLIRRGQRDFARKWYEAELQSCVDFRKAVLQREARELLDAIKARN